MPAMSEEKGRDSFSFLIYKLKHITRIYQESFHIKTDFL